MEQTGRRLWALAGPSVEFVAGATVLPMLPLHALAPTLFPLESVHLLHQMQFNLLPTAVVQTLYEALYFFQQWEANARRADQLARTSTQAQLDALQSQLDPHFLFNNLNTLAALIEPSNAPAQQFEEQLGEMYRYVLLAQGPRHRAAGRGAGFRRNLYSYNRTRHTEGNLVILQRKICQHRHLLRTKDLLVLGTF